jgi:hypothetical protein
VTVRTIPISLVPLGDSAPIVERSGFILLRRDGDTVNKGEPIACCALYMHPSRRAAAVMPFVDQLDYQLVLLAPISGTVSWSPGISHGSWRDWLAFGSKITWKETCELGTVTGSSVDEVPVPDDRRALICSGRRMVPTSDVRGGLLPGWYDRVRAWNLQDVATSLVIATTCHIRPAVFGETRAFHEFLTESAKPIHVNFLAETLIVPTARVVHERLARTESEWQIIAAQIQGWLGTLREEDKALSAAHLSFLLGNLGGPSPLDEPVVLLSLDGLQEISKPTFVLLSLDSESADTYKHYELPFSLSLPTYIYPFLGSDFKRILEDEFTQIPESSPEELADIYRQLAARLGRNGTSLLVANTIVIERGPPLCFPGELRDLSRSSSHRARILNTMLYALEQEGVLTVVDLDSLSATLGVNNIPDGAHGNRAFSEAARKLLLRHVTSDIT